MSIKPIGIATVAICLLANWASQPEKNGAQFFGTLETRQGNNFKVNNIVVGDSKKTEVIPVYEKPKNPDSFTKTDPTHITLNIDPKSGDLAIIYLNLDKITAINVIFDVEKLRQIAEATILIAKGELHASSHSRAGK